MCFAARPSERRSGRWNSVYVRKSPRAGYGFGLEGKGSIVSQFTTQLQHERLREDTGKNSWDGICERSTVNGDESL